MPYIYLDWNVVKYMKNPRKDMHQREDEYFAAKIFDLSKKGEYLFPYSEAHIKDRANKYKPENYRDISKDLLFFEFLNHSQCLGTIDEMDTLGISKRSILEFFEEYIQECKRSPSDEELLVNSFSMDVDMDKIDTSNPLYDLLKPKNGYCSQRDMMEFMVKMYQTIFNDTSQYKKLRDYVPSVSMDLNDLTQNGQQSVYKKALYEHLNPFMESREYDIDELRKQWKSICESWFSLNHTLPLKKSQLLIQGYTLLDMHPLFGEKLKKNKNTLDNIIRDGNHVYYASEADFFVSEDETTRKKTSFMYEAFDIRTKVVSEKEFLSCYNIERDTCFLL